MNPDFVASSSLVSGTVTAHTSHFGSAILSFLPLLPCCLLPKQQVHHSQHFYPPPCNNSTASSSMHLSAAVSSSSVVCSSLYSPPCLIFTAPIPQSLQTHLWFLRCFSLCPTSIWYQYTKFPAQTSPGSELLQAASHLLPTQRRFLGHSLRYFTRTCVFPSLPSHCCQSVRRACTTDKWGRLSCSHYLSYPHLITLAGRALPAGATSLFVQPASEWLDTKTLQYIKY